MPPSNTLWPLDPHTHGKHLVLQHYMEAWLPIMTRWNSKVLFIDGFAGPGKYSKGEDGSPVIALKALVNHSAKRRMTNDIIYLFIEKDEERCNHLQQIIKEIEHELPDNCRYYVESSTFNDALSKILDHVEESNGNLIPAFVMIDPFGVSDTPMDTISRILSNPKSEVYISFMYDSINRFRAQPHFELNLDRLFGCEQWREGVDIPDFERRKDFFFNLYKKQLQASGAKYVQHFELYEGDRLIYAIFFGTHDLEGCDQMKQAIWKVAPFGDFKFKGSQLNQLNFGPNLTDFTQLQDALKDEFIPKGWVKIKDVIDFVKSDKTRFHSNHLKTSTLKPMEEHGEIEVRSNSARRKGTFPEDEDRGVEIRFLDEPAISQKGFF